MGVFAYNDLLGIAAGPRARARRLIGARRLRGLGDDGNPSLNFGPPTSIATEVPNPSLNFGPGEAPSGNSSLNFGPSGDTGWAPDHKASDGTWVSAGGVAYDGSEHTTFTFGPGSSAASSAGWVADHRSADGTWVNAGGAAYDGSIHVGAAVPPSTAIRQPVASQPTASEVLARAAAQQQRSAAPVLQTLPAQPSPFAFLRGPAVPQASQQKIPTLAYVGVGGALVFLVGSAWIASNSRMRNPGRRRRRSRRAWA